MLNSSKDNTQENCSAHHLSASLIQMIHVTLKHPQNESLKGISTRLLATCLQGKLMQTQSGHLWRSSIYQLFLFLSTAWKIFTIWQLNLTGNCSNCLFKVMYRQNCLADYSREIGQMQLHWSGKRIKRFRVDFEVPLHGMYIFDTQEKTDPRNTNSFLLRWETQRLEERAQHGPFPALSVWTSSLSGMAKKTWT